MCVDHLRLVVRCWELLQCGFHAPDLAGVLGNGAVTGELATSGNIVDHLLGPFLRVLVQEGKRGSHDPLYVGFMRPVAALNTAHISFSRL